MLYSQDYQDNIAWNLRASAGAVVNGKLTGSWVNGAQDVPLSEINAALLVTDPVTAPPLLGPYVGKNPKIYKCPADFRTAVDTSGQRQPAVRSYSMNGYFGAPPNDPLEGTVGKIFRKQSAVTRASDLFVLTEEAPFSINDGDFYFFGDGPNGVAWGDCAGAYHGTAAGIFFADGHAEFHKWRGAVAKYGSSLTGNGWSSSSTAKDLDWQWFQVHGYVLK